MRTATCGPVAAWEVRADEFPDHAEAREKLAFLLHYAILAPSGHNTQPWLFALDGDTVELHADRAQALPAVDPENRALTISCGAALLNLRVALRRFGYRDDTVELLPDPTRPDLLARVRLVAGEPPSREEEALFDAIPARRTTRAAYDEREVPAKLQRSLVREAVREGAWLHLVPDAQRGAVAELVAGRPGPDGGQALPPRARRLDAPEPEPSSPRPAGVRVRLR